MNKLLKVGFFALFAFSIFSCNEQKVLNRTVKLDSGERMLTGEFEPTVLNEKHYASWYQPEYDAYEVEKAKLADIKKDIKKYDIEIFVGTWCGDSQRELPRLLKILEEVKHPYNRMNLYGVNRQKKSFYGEEMGKNITHVPTIIFYAKGKEVGRIVESPVSGYLEEDIAMIIKGTPLTPNYSED